ncbi:hypothetical protein GDO81_018000 [Engystomops pustulosus]|uniref:Uncharacterized protein n=1 Tax=Engystomops pustulosus TaxID=76066 RepID=A0AAV7A3T7_ENGPU|nr:hypothetical protein GDO81_018000 [Engystomops pustulosus]
MHLSKLPLQYLNVLISLNLGKCIAGLNTFYGQYTMLVLPLVQITCVTSYKTSANIILYILRPVYYACLTTCINHFLYLI